MPDKFDLMTPEMYPDIGSPIGAVVVGYTEDERNQIWLSVKPSVLQKALVHLKVMQGGQNPHRSLYVNIKRFTLPTISARLLGIHNLMIQY